MQQRFKEYVGNKEPLKSNFETCAVTPTEDIIFIIGRTIRGDGRLLTLETLYIKELTPVPKTKDEYKRRTLTLNFEMCNFILFYY